MTFKLAPLVAVASLLTAALAAAPASAASPRSDIFLANVRPNVEFLDSSSRLAMTHSSSPRIRAFARSEAIEQTITANSLYAFASVNVPTTAPMVVVGAVTYAPVVGLATLPLDLAANVATNVVTGRSVGLNDPYAPRFVAQPGLLRSGETDLDRLVDLGGRSFDALYRSTQTDALRQLATLYRDYMQNGDDDALLVIATRELPKINRRLRELSAI